MYVDSGNRDLESAKAALQTDTRTKIISLPHGDINEKGLRDIVFSIYT